MAEREARRRRIQERGSDRMALITGKVQALAPFTPPSSSPSSARSTYSNPFVTPLSTTGETSHVRQKTEGDNSPAKTLKEQNMSSRFARGRAFNYGKTAEAPKPKPDKTPKTPPGIGSPRPKHDKNPRTPPGTISAREMRLKTKKHPQTLTPNKVSHIRGAFRKKYKLFSAREINSSIVATEGTRVLCTAVIAFFVVLLNINLPSSIVDSANYVASKPLYILLVSDTVIVVLKMMERRRYLEIKEDDEKIVRILQIGWVFYRTLRALLIDVGCYTAVIVCGFCIMGK